MLFWIIAAAAALIAAYYVAKPVLSSGGDAAPRAAHDMQVFRDQLKEVERDAERGVITPEEAEGTRLEIQRRLLAADAESRREGARATPPRKLSAALAAGLIIAAPVAGFGLYTHLGAPGAKDTPFASRENSGRPSQEEAEAMMAGRTPPEPEGPQADEIRAIIVKLKERLEETPDDPQGLFFLGRELLNISRFSEAWPQFRKIADQQGEDAGPRIWAGLSEGMILAAGGYVSPEAEAALVELLKREPTNPSGRYYLGLLHSQQGRDEFAVAVWTSLLEESPADAPWVAPIRQQLAALGAEAAPASPGPAAADIEAARQMAEGDRQEMIRNMVTGLHERLTAEGEAGDVNEWIKLIRSYGVLEETQKQRAAYDEARAIWAADSIALAALKQSALLNGIETDD